MYQSPSFSVRWIVLRHSHENRSICKFFKSHARSRKQQLIWNLLVMAKISTIFPCYSLVYSMKQLLISANFIKKYIDEFQDRNWLRFSLPVKGSCSIWPPDVAFDVNLNSFLSKQINHSKACWSSGMILALGSVFFIIIIIIVVVVIVVVLKLSFVRICTGLFSSIKPICFEMRLYLQTSVKNIRKNETFFVQIL